MRLHLNRHLLHSVYSSIALLLLSLLLFCDYVSSDGKAPLFLDTKKSLIQSSSENKSENNFFFSKQEHSLFPYFPEYFLHHETGRKNMKTQCMADAAEKNQRDGIQQGYCMLPGT